MIHVLRTKATKQQLSEMLAELEVYVKLAVDIEQGVVAGGGALHADCEAALLADGSGQDAIWGADWIARTEEVRFEALINIRPDRGNASMTIQDAQLRDRVRDVVRGVLEGV